MYKRVFCTIIAVLTLSIAMLNFGCSQSNNHELNNGIETDTPYITANIVTPPPVLTPNCSQAAPSEDPSTDAPIITEYQNASQTGYGEIIDIEINNMPARNTMPTELYSISADECEKWFGDCVFVGDSIMLGWKNYNAVMAKNLGREFFGNTRFFCEGSYGYGHALEPVNADSLHPMFAGEKHNIEDALSLMNAKKAFICFGLNDISIYGIEGTVENCTKLVDNIYSKNPSISLYIISAMYMYEGSERPKLNNANILKLNIGLAEFCNSRSIPFINLASHLIDEKGFVPDEYSSDQYVHQTYKAYDVWAEVLRSVAAREIAGIKHPVFK